MHNFVIIQIGGVPLSVMLVCGARAFPKRVDGSRKAHTQPDLALARTWTDVVAVLAE